MNRSVLGSVAAAVFTLGIATASAQLSPQGSGATALTPEQRTAIRMVIAERLAGEMRDTLPDRLNEAAAALPTLTPEQRAAVRSAIKARLGEDVREVFPRN